MQSCLLHGKKNFRLCQTKLLNITALLGHKYNSDDKKFDSLKANRSILSARGKKQRRCCKHCKIVDTDCLLGMFNWFKSANNMSVNLCILACSCGHDNQLKFKLIIRLGKKRWLKWLWIWHGFSCQLGRQSVSNTADMLGFWHTTMLGLI